MLDHVEQKLMAAGYTLPEPMKLPPGLVLPFSFVKVHEKRILVSGHLPLSDNGGIWQVEGKVGADVSIDEAYLAAQRATLAMLSSIKREIGSLDRIDQWLKIFGMVNTAPGFTQTANVINGSSDLIIEIFGDVAGSHTRSAVGFAEIPFNCPVEIEAELILK